MGGETRRIGVGVLLNPSLGPILEELLEVVDYAAIIPDRCWRDHGVGSSPRFELLENDLDLLQAVSEVVPVPLHGIGLSICSAEIFDVEYVRQMAVIADTLHSPWISDHLSYTRVGTGHEVNAGVPMPIPYDHEMLDLLAPRIEKIRNTCPRPFLLENNVAYVRFPCEDMSEEEFFNRLCARTGCNVLLDLHNVYTNATNHGFDPNDYLDNLDLANVVEIHVAGGTEMLGYYTDSHTGPVAQPVWRLLNRVVPKATSLRGVTFEFHESSLSDMGTKGVVQQVQIARQVVATALQEVGAGVG